MGHPARSPGAAGMGPALRLQSSKQAPGEGSSSFGERSELQSDVFTHLNWISEALGRPCASPQTMRSSCRRSRRLHSCRIALWFLKGLRAVSYTTLSCFINGSKLGRELVNRNKASLLSTLIQKAR